MSVDFPAHIAAEESWTRQLASEPGWREYIERKADVMAKHSPGL
jgi:hypothetical protein